MTPAQLEVLERMKQKQSVNAKGRKSVKPAPASEASTDEVETDTVSETNALKDYSARVNDPSNITYNYRL